MLIMANDVLTTVSLTVAVSQWDVSSETLLGALEEGVDGARKLEDDKWEIPTGWLDSTYQRNTVIDLRDVGSELAVVLDHLLVTRDRLGDAEIRAVKAETESRFLLKDIERLEAEVSRAESDAEHWLAQHDEREQDLVSEQIKTAQAIATSEELRYQLTETEVRLDSTYHDLIEARELVDQTKKTTMFGRLRRGKRSN